MPFSQPWMMLQPMVTKTPSISQDNPDLIYNLSNMPSWLYVEYISGGLYDRVIANDEEYKNEPVLFEQDEFQWVRQTLSSSNINIVTKVNLLKKESYNDKGYFTVKDDSLFYLELIFWKSSVYKNIQAVSWHNSNLIIKPIKILKHEWEAVVAGSAKSSYKCKVCDMVGYKVTNTRSAILPEKLLTCDQKIIENILV